MSKISKKETIELLDEFININGMWDDFISFVEEKGYDIQELNMETE